MKQPSAERASAASLNESIPAQFAAHVLPLWHHEWLLFPAVPSGIGRAFAAEADIGLAALVCKTRLCNGAF